MKYGLPPFLLGVVDQQRYSRWLRAKADAHYKRDRGRGNLAATREQYREAIHGAVVASGGLDAYTGLPLRWDLISLYRNEDSQNNGRQYKHQFGDLPTVDHIGDGLGAPDFAICSWRVNDAKHDLPYDRFVQVCRDVLAHHENRRGAT